LSGGNSGGAGKEGKAGADNAFPGIKVLSRGVRARGSKVLFSKAEKKSFCIRSCCSHIRFYVAKSNREQLRVHKKKNT
jgi:hypothetical protein